MNDQQTQATLNALPFAQLAGEVLDFKPEAVVGLQAYFIHVKGWAYWADFPTVDDLNFSGLPLSPKPGSPGATVAGFCWTILTLPTWTEFITKGRAGEVLVSDASVTEYDILTGAVPEPAPEPAPVYQMQQDAAPAPKSAPEHSVSNAVEAPVSDEPGAVSAPASPPATTPVADSRAHVIGEPSDTLYSIAKAYGLSPTQLERYNPDVPANLAGVTIFLAG